MPNSNGNAELASQVFVQDHDEGYVLGAGVVPQSSTSADRSHCVRVDGEPQQQGGNTMTEDNEDLEIPEPKRDHRAKTNQAVDEVNANYALARRTLMKSLKACTIGTASFMDHAGPQPAPANTGAARKRPRSSFKTALQLARTFPSGALASQVCPYCYSTGYSSPGTRCSYCQR
jgi:hypothetical protein